MRQPRLLAVVASACLVLAPATVRAVGPVKYDSGDPTPPEQRVLEMINRARADPAAEGRRLGIDIDEGVPNGAHAVARPPLAMNASLLAAARAHSRDMYTRSYFAHTNLDGIDPFQRMAAAGYSGGRLGENIATGSNHSAATLEDLLMRDPGYPGRGHRVNLLDIGAGSPYREIGIGYSTDVMANSSGYRDFVTEDLGASSVGPFVVGVVYADRDANGSYDAGEGLAGVTVTPNAGGYFAVTGAAGGYSFPVPSTGTVNVTAWGGALASPVTTTVTMAGLNVKVDFVPGAAAGGSTSNSLVDGDADGFPDELESALGTSPGDSADTPFGGAPASPLPLTAPRLDVRLDFRAPAKDRLTFECRVPVADGFAADGRTLVVDVGGVIRQFTLDADGRAVGQPLRTVHLTVPRVPRRKARLVVRLTDAELAAALADEGLLDLTTRRRVRVSVPAIVLLDGTAHAVTKALRYTAKQGKAGSAK